MRNQGRLILHMFWLRNQQAWGKSHRPVLPRLARLCWGACKNQLCFLSCEHSLYPNSRGFNLNLIQKSTFRKIQMIGWGMRILHLNSTSQANIIKDSQGKLVRVRGNGGSVRARESDSSNSCLINYTCEVNLPLTSNSPTNKAHKSFIWLPHCYSD